MCLGFTPTTAWTKHPKSGVENLLAIIKLISLKFSKIGYLNSKVFHLGGSSEGEGIVKSGHLKFEVFQFGGSGGIWNYKKTSDLRWSILLPTTTTIKSDILVDKFCN